MRQGDNDYKMVILLNMSLQASPWQNDLDNGTDMSDTCSIGQCPLE